MKRICLTISIFAALFFCEATFAQGFYFGGGGGYLRLSDHTLTPGVTAQGGLLSQDKPLYGEGYSATVFVGYQLDLSKLFALAIEGHVNYTDASAKVEFLSPATSQTAGQRLRGSYDIELLPSIKITPESRIFGVIGWSKTRVKSYNTIFTDINGVRNTTQSSIDYRYVNGFVVGGGVSTQTSKHFSIRAEYLFKRYRKFQFNDAIAQTNIAERPEVFLLNLSVAYSLT